MRKRGSLWLAAAFGALLTLALAACVPMAAPTAAPAPTATPVVAKPTPTAAPVVAAPKYGGTLRYGLDATLKSPDPVWTTASVTNNVARQIWDPLVTWDSEFASKPVMLESWKASDDLKTWTFTLRKGLLFHDNTAITTEDVIASMKRWGGRIAKGVSYFRLIDTIQKVDELTFTIKFKKPFGLAFDYLDLNPFIMPARMAATPGAERLKEWTGSGPFQFVEWKEGDRFVIKRFEGYKPRAEPKDGEAGARIAYIDRVEMKDVPDAATRVAAVEVGELDVAHNIPHDFYDRFKDRKDVDLLILTPGSLNMTVFNNAVPPFNNLKARQAVREVSVAKDYLASAYPGALGQECVSLWYCGTDLETSEAAELIYNRPDNIEKGKKLWAEFVAETGWKGKIALMTNTDYRHHYLMSQVTLRDLEKKLGLAVDYQVSDWATVVTRRAEKKPVEEGGWNIFHTRWGYDGSRDPFVSGYLSPTWFAYYDNPTIATLIDDFATATTAEARKKAAVQIQRIIYEEVPVIPHGTSFSITVKRPDVIGYDAYYAFTVALWNVWLKR